MDYVTVAAGQRLAVDDRGTGPALVFAHCLGGSRDAWAAQVAFFCKLYRCVAYDLRGQGDSTVVAGESSMQALARDALDLLDALQIDRCVFVGISMGGMVAQQLALMAPGRIAGLVLADTAAGFDQAGRDAWRDRIGQVRRDGLSPLVDTMMGRWFTDAFRAAHPEVVASIAGRLRSTDVEGYLAACAAIRNHDLSARLGEIRCPTLVLCGEHDPSTPLPLSQVLATGIPGARLAVMPGVRHLPNIESPDAFNAVLSGFLAEIAYS